MKFEEAAMQWEAPREAASQSLGISRLTSHLSWGRKALLLLVMAWFIGYLYVLHRKQVRKTLDQLLSIQQLVKKAYYVTTGLAIVCLSVSLSDISVSVHPSFCS